MLRTAAPALVVLTLFARPAHACLACNIYNYLGENFRSSPNVIIGRVVEVPGDNKVRVEVIAVLRGAKAAGETIEWSIGYREAKSGEKYILSDPQNFGAPEYRCLPMKFEDEVRFLLEFGPDMVPPPDNKPWPKPGTPVIRSLDQAIRLAQGISNESRRYAFEYIGAMATHPSGQLFQALQLRIKQSEPDAHQLVCLVDALMLKPTEQGDAFVLAEIRRIISSRSRPRLDWASIPQYASAQGEYLRALVGCTDPQFNPLWLGSRSEPHRKANVQLRASQRDLLLAEFPDLDLETAADVTYALCSTRTATPSELLRLAPADHTDGVALGLYYVGNRKAWVWSKGIAKRAYELALSATTQPALQAELQKRLNSLGDSPTVTTDPPDAAAFFDSVAKVREAPASEGSMRGLGSATDGHPASKAIILVLTLLFLIVLWILLTRQRS